MKVTAALQVPDEATVRIIVTATISELLDLSRQLNKGSGWSKAGELLAAAIRNAAAQLRADVEQVIEQTPENT